MNKNEKILIEVYKLFFDEVPDFSNEDTPYRVQSMMNILNEYSIRLYNENGFSIKFGNPWSDNVQNTIDTLVKLGKIDIHNNENIYIDSKVKNIISIIGKFIKKYIKDNFKGYETEILQNISIISYAITDNYPNKLKQIDILELEYVKCDEQTITDIMNLLEEIRKYIIKYIYGKEFYQKTEEFIMSWAKLFNRTAAFEPIETNGELPLTMPSLNIEKDYIKIGEDGFIENYCLSEREQKQLKKIRKKHETV